MTNDLGNSPSGALGDTDSVSIVVATSPIAFVGASATGSDSPTLALTRPTGTADGNVLITTITTRNLAVTTLTGWTPISSVATTPGAAAKTFYYWKVASSEPTSYTWAIGATGRVSGVVVAFSNVDTASPFIAQSSQNNSAQSTDVSAPAQVPGVTDTYVVYAGSVANGQAWQAGSRPASVWPQTPHSTGGGATGTKTTTLMAYKSMGTQTTTTGTIVGKIVSAAAADNTGWSATLRPAVTTFAPVLTASGGTTAHTENVPVVVDSGITVTDTDSANLASGHRDPRCRVHRRPGRARLHHPERHHRFLERTDDDADRQRHQGELADRAPVGHLQQHQRHAEHRQPDPQLRGQRRHLRQQHRRQDGLGHRRQRRPGAGGEWWHDRPHRERAGGGRLAASPSPTPTAPTWRPAP